MARPDPDAEIALDRLPTRGRRPYATHMSLWTRIRDALEALSSGSSFADFFETLTRPPEKTVAFTIAVIGLGAKMAKADGVVTRNEVTAFREIFRIDPADEAHAARIFNLARQDVRGYQAYARSIARMFREDHQTLVDLLEGLFYIAAADGVHHPLEDAFLADVAEIFGLSDDEFAQVKCRTAPPSEADPYAILGVGRNDDIGAIKSAWRAAVKDNHPDQMLARGVPEEAIKLATNRLTALNTAWEAIQLERAA